MNATSTTTHETRLWITDEHPEWADTWMLPICYFDCSCGYTSDRMLSWEAIEGADDHEAEHAT